jgi:hypothetical protein
MLRRDYILRLIEEFGRALARILDEKQRNLWPEARASIQDQVRALTGTDLDGVASLTDTELLDCLMKTGDFRGAGPKPLLLARVLLEATDPNLPQSPDTARALRLKALHLLLYAALHGEVHDWPEFVPTIEGVVRQFEPGSLPLHTHALLMQHFERAGDFAQAENALFAMADLAGDYPALQALGLAFYQRLLAKPDNALENGNLPRAEVEAGQREFRERIERFGG